MGGLSSWSFRPAVGQGEFLAWLLAKAGQSDIVGDLATDMVRDRLLPQTSDPKLLSDYLRTQTVANDAVQGALVSAWLAYHTGFKQFPIEVLNFLPLLKAYALLQGFFSSLDSDPESVERLYTDAHRRVLPLLGGVIEILGYRRPQSYSPKLARDTEDTLTPRGHMAVGVLLAQSERLIERDGPFCWASA